jgi:origin recognition complex subunit 6
MSTIEQYLSLLVPSLSDHFPSELVALSSSLLAQSLNKASNLKSEEEIARPYACCEIACKRLGSKLKLPALHGRPPCAPRVYRKLLTFLEQALPARLPTKAAEEPPKTSNNPSAKRNTPKKAAPYSSQSTPQTTTKKRSTAFAGKVLQKTPQHQEQNDDGAPPWAMPLIRRLCLTFSTPLLPPHVYTGLCIVSKLAKLPAKQEAEEHTYERDMTSLTVALFFMVLSKMQRGKVSSESYSSDCSSACTIANEEHPTIILTQEHIDEWIKRISSENWTTDQEWWSSVPENIFDRTRQSSPPADTDDPTINLTATKKRQRITSSDTEQDPEDTLLPGLGTMMQESIDWLSEDRRADYLDWRAGIESRIKSMDQGIGRKRIRGKGKGVTAR